MAKMNLLQLSDNIHNWIINYFKDRAHITKFAGEISKSASINASVIQGSVIGPASYIVGSSDLHPLNDMNKQIKYADDTYLLIGSNHLHTVTDELAHTAAWAKDNNLRLNPLKTREMLISRKQLDKLVIPTIISGAERVESMRILGVTITSDLRMDLHLEGVLASASSSLYALGILRSHGLTGKPLHEVAQATTLAHTLYASPAWWGYASTEERDKIDKLLNRMKRRGFLPIDIKSAADLAMAADQGLFRAICLNPDHVLRELLPSIRQSEYHLRQRTHNFTLPKKDDRNFINRILFKNIY